jgi:uncharacterized protein YaaR (DUF327 family)
MDVHKIKRPEPVSFPSATAAGTSGGSSGESFQGQLGSQLKENYRRHISGLLDDLSGLSDSLLGVIDINAFEKYRGLIRELLTGIVRNAYLIDSEQPTDGAGRRRSFESVSIIDSKLDALARDILKQSGEKLDYISRVDEIRGLILDMLL